MPRLSDAQRRALALLENGPLFYSAGHWRRRGTDGAHPSVIDHLIDRQLVRRIEQRKSCGLTVTLCRLTSTGEQAAKGRDHA